MKKIKKLFESDKLPFIVLFLVMLVATLFKSTTSGDDNTFAIFITGEYDSNITSIFKYWPWRYNSWSSRLIIETVLIFFAKDLPVLWKFVDSFMYVVLAYSLSKLFVKDNKKILNWIIVLLIFCIPFGIFSTAGWMATSLNYLWTVSLGLYALIPIRKTLDSEKIKKYEYVLFILAAIYACNFEQVGLCIAAVYFIFNIFFIINKNVKKINIVMLIIAILSLVFILVCPGNKVRVKCDTEMYYPDFANFSIFEKLEIGLVTTMQYYMFNFNIIYFLFTLLLVIKVFKNKKNIFCKALAIYPFLMGVIFNFSGIFSRVSTRFLRKRDAVKY